MMNKFGFALCICSCSSATGFADDIKDQFNPVQTACTSLTISSDVAGMALGNAGVATSPNLWSQHSNPAKYAFEDARFSIGSKYQPWLRELTEGIFLFDQAAFVQFKGNAISTSFKYFSLGDVYVGDTDIIVNPYEYSLDVAYSRRVNNNFSLGIAARYIYSDLSGHYDDNTTPGTAFAVDIAGYWNKKYKKVTPTVGFNIKNIGTKINYGSDYSYFIPTSLNIGAGVYFEPHRFHRIGLFLEANKLLVPSMPLQFDDELNEDYQERVREEYYNMSPIKGIFTSFSDSERGAKGEFEEIQWHFGVEYNLFKHAFFRLGYNHESEMQGNRKYFTLGHGCKFDWVSANFAWYKSVTRHNPLDNTFAIDLSFRLPYFNK